FAAVGGKIIITVETEQDAQKFTDMFKKYNIEVNNIHHFQNTTSAYQDDNIKINICVLDINFHFEFCGVRFFSAKQIFNLNARQKTEGASYRKIKSNSEKLNQIQDLKSGELIVHVDYGIGRFVNITSITTCNTEKDFAQIEYSNHDKFYLPVENIELISKYNSDNIEEVILDKLGANHWKKKCAALKEKIRITALNIIETAAKRASIESPIINPISALYDQFILSFPYKLTICQENAINETLSDLESGVAMDRLICGDVGFGKTEIALRAACAVTCSETAYQVAIIVPTTLLARQHYKIFCERFSGLPVNIAQISKLIPKKNIKDIKNDLKAGKIDIVIGTHALLRDDIVFQNLALVIIDEEQRFGTAQKEKLKEVKEGVHVLTLAATPIPRTLQMAICDIKKLSIISTPLPGRKEVKTHIIKYDKSIIRDAILKEILRDGRVFYITPRIEYMKEIEEQCKMLDIELRICFVHGGMSANQIDDIMNKFYDNEFNIMIATSIIELGIDMPFANTLIIDRAHMFGLSQLHQMRGRIGRSEKSAYAYFILPNNITNIAKIRLDALNSMSYAGAGLSIATQDLEIRGCGNLLGDKQSGYIKEIGLDMYNQMLASSIEEFQSDNQYISSKTWSPVVNLDISARIPTDYIADDDLRLRIYRKIALVSNHTEIQNLKTEISQEFGHLPNQVNDLFEITHIKQAAKTLGISRIDRSKIGYFFKFHEESALIEKVKSEYLEQNIDIKLKGNGIFIYYDTGDECPISVSFGLLDKINKMVN
ncbi:MAG: helicase-related protein, partial [Proteobacteria bacterium]|nr:helicase-related protein [Pseudomonadota bacterium]